MRSNHTIVVFLLTALSSNVRAQFFTKVESTPISSVLGDSRSVNWVDVNMDGNVDLFISNGPSGGQNNTLFLNLGAGGFSAVFTDSIVLDNQPSDGATFADVDNDGTIDAFVVNWYNQDNLFYMNNGDGTFTKNNSDIISNDAGYSETASWADYDNDGLVDLYVTNSAGGKKNFLYHNEGNGNFSKIIVGTMVNDAFFSRNVSWVDIDTDQDLDLFVTNENNQHENIYRNDGLGVFTKLTSGALLNDGGNTNSSSWADVDNDGDLDVFLANHGGFNALFKNDGNFNFTKITTDTVSTTPAKSISSAWSDIDNDGDVDLFVTNAFGTTTKQLNFLYINDGDGNFSRNTLDVVVNDSSWSYGCAFADYDNDGFEDLAVATCRFESVDYANFLYHNNTNSNHWITMKLVGTVSNQSAIGAKVRIKATMDGVPIWQMREISSQSSYNGQNDLRVHFGIKNATTIDSIRIEWPLGLVEEYTNFTPDQFYEFVEGLGYTELSEYNPNTERPMTVYPNPATDQLSIRFKEDELCKGGIIRFLDAHGSTLRTSDVSNLETELLIDLTDLSIRTGLFFILWERKNEASILTKVVITN